MIDRPQREPPGPGQESVWDYPRPPVVEVSTEHVVVEFAGRVVADTRRAVRVLETSHPPSYYLPRADVDTSMLETVARRTVCEFKGEAAYADLVVGDRRSRLACWWYPTPAPGFETLRDRVTFYPSRVDRALVDGEQVTSSEGDFYGGWITSRVVGPFKGAPGTAFW